MKKITLIIVLIFTTQLFSQYNLEFSQVLTFDLVPNQEAEVPVGYVWKVESGNAGGVTINGSATTYGEPVLYNTGQFSTSGTWLKTGDILVNLTNNRKGFSIIEFKLVAVGSSSGGGGSGDSGSGGFDSGTSTGNQFSSNAGVPGDNFTDSDGNVYETTNINGMIWITSNYEGTTYSDGTPIPYISDLDEWSTSTTGAYTYYKQDSSLGYGKLYNIHAIRGRHDDDDSTPYKKFAPDGWHLPQQSEYVFVTNLYGGMEASLFSIKSQTDWLAGTSGNNISGLNIKGYPKIESYSTTDKGWLTTDGIAIASNNQFGRSTYFYLAEPSDADFLRMQSAVYSSFDSQSVNASVWSYTPFLSVVGNYNNNEDNDAVYVRLVKDY